MNKNTNTYSIVKAWVAANCGPDSGIVHASVLSAEAKSRSGGATVIELDAHRHPRLEIWVAPPDEKGAHTLLADDGVDAKFAYTCEPSASALHQALDQMAAPLFAANDDAPLAA